MKKKNHKTNKTGEIITGSSTSTSGSGYGSDSILDLSDDISIERIPIDSSSLTSNNNNNNNNNNSMGNNSNNTNTLPSGGSAIGVITDIGVRVTCKKYGIETEFRVVFPEQELMLFLDALCMTTHIRNLAEFKHIMHWDDKPDWIPVSSTINSRNPLIGTFIDPNNVEAQLNMSRMTVGDSDTGADDIDIDGEGYSGFSGLQGYSTSYDTNTISHMVSAPISMLMNTLSFNGNGGNGGNGNGSEYGTSKSHRMDMNRSTHTNTDFNASMSMNPNDRNNPNNPNNSYAHGQQSIGGGKQYIIQQSVMRRAITKAMDRYDRDARYSQTISRRGAFKWLPVAFTNDLVHGSWWFVFGALLTTVISVIILLNSYYPHQLLGVDRDMGLPLDLYRVTWVMLSVSGGLYFIGSLAFVRAVNEPPMRPLFPGWIHTSTDELLGSWLFFYGTVPSIPYSILYLYWFGNYWYLGMLVVAVISTMACYLFVLSCYPSDKVCICVYEILNI